MGEFLILAFAKRMILVSIAIALTMGLWFVIGCKVTDISWRHRAVNAGKAEWTVTTNGAVEWRWKP